MIFSEEVSRAASVCDVYASTDVADMNDVTMESVDGEEVTILLSTCFIYQNSVARINSPSVSLRIDETRTLARFWEESVFCNKLHQ